MVLPVDAFFTRFDYNSTGAGDGGGTTAGEMDDDADDVLSKSRNTFQYVLRPNATTKDVSFSFTLRDNSVFQVWTERYQEGCIVRKHNFMGRGHSLEL